MLWHQSLKSIHYRTLLIFQNRKINRFEGQNMGVIKDMLSPPPCQNMGGIYHPHPPQDLRPWFQGENGIALISMLHVCSISRF